MPLPPTGNTYVLMPVMDAWSNVIGEPGSSDGAGAAEQKFAITGPGWNGNLPDGLKAIKHTTNLVCVVGRTALDPSIPDDMDIVHQLQSKYDLSPLEPGVPAIGLDSVFGPAVMLEKKTLSEIVDDLPAAEFFDLLAKAMIKNPAFPEDAPALAEFATIGFVPGEKFVPTDAVSVVLTIIPKQSFQRMMKRSGTLGTVENNWNVILSGIGVYGIHYLVRGAIAVTSFAANRPETAVYPNTLIDSIGAYVSAQDIYRMHFAADEIPPVRAFWSLTLYDNEGYLVANPANRYSVNSYTAELNDDGSLDLFISQNQPAEAKPANWLPANLVANDPGGSPNFSLTMRLYEPDKAILSGEWKPAFVELVTKGS